MLLSNIALIIGSVLGVDAASSPDISNDGIAASLSIGKTHYNVMIPWRVASAVECMICFQQEE